MTVQKKYQLGFDAWEVGYSRPGCSDRQEIVDAQRNELEEFIERYGEDADQWWEFPEIRHFHNHEATVGVLDFGRKITVNRLPCQYAILGVLRYQPLEGWIPEGVRLPRIP